MAAETREVDRERAFTVDNPSWTIVLKDGGKSLVLKRLGLTVIVR